MRTNFDHLADSSLGSISKKSMGAHTIMEQDGEESEVSAVNIVTNEEASRRELADKNVVINKYKRID